MSTPFFLPRLPRRFMEGVTEMAPWAEIYGNQMNKKNFIHCYQPGSLSLLATLMADVPSLFQVAGDVLPTCLAGQQPYTCLMQRWVTTTPSPGKLALAPPGSLPTLSLLLKPHDTDEESFSIRTGLLLCFLPKYSNGKILKMNIKG